jgi:phosphonatase-like hydrolase
MKVEAILFDVIGTTVQEKDPNTVNNCLFQAFTKHSVIVDSKTLNQFRGRDKKEIIRLTLAANQLPEARATQILESFNLNIIDSLHNFSGNEGAEELFAYLRGKQIKFGLGTGLSRELFELILKHLRWKKSDFDYIGIANELPRSRPHPDMIFDMMKILNVSNPTQFLKIGDTVSDIQEGKHAGVITAAMLSGTQPDEVLKSANPDFILKGLPDVKNIVD